MCPAQSNDLIRETSFKLCKYRGVMALFVPGQSTDPKASNMNALRKVVLSLAVFNTSMHWDNFPRTATIKGSRIFRNASYSSALQVSLTGSSPLGTPRMLQISCLSNTITLSLRLNSLKSGSMCFMIHATRFTGTEKSDMPSKAPKPASFIQPICS